MCDDVSAGKLNICSWDTYRSDNIVIQNSYINNGDDCVSFKPNSTNIVVQNLACNGSHGISVGSLGQYPGEVDIVKNIFVSQNTTTHEPKLTQSRSPTSACPTHPTAHASKCGRAPKPPCRAT
jgi:hypothetical protein